MPTNPTGFAVTASPFGPLWVEVLAGKITQLHWAQIPPQVQAVAHPLQHSLTAYFNGQGITVKATDFTPTGTPFQQRVWAELLNIPHGQTRTYGQLAAALNSSPRAVGGAVGANPLPILIPCHRVLGANGKMTGFSAPGGIASKQILLKLEGTI
jgi:methylated-DNA-[protein]-cysteine S-methyltransferase